LFLSSLNEETSYSLTKIKADIMQASAPAFVPSFQKVSQAQELSYPFGVDLGDQYDASYNNTMQFSPTPMMWNTGNCNMISFDAYSDDESDEDEPFPSKQVESTVKSQEDKASTVDDSDASFLGESDSEIEVSETVSHVGQAAGQMCQIIISMQMLLKLRGTVDNSQSKPLWKTLKPPPGLEDVPWQKNEDESYPSESVESSTMPQKDYTQSRSFQVKSPCPSTCDGSGVSCSGESDSETLESDSEMSDQEINDTKRPWRMESQVPKQMSIGTVVRGDEPLLKAAPWRKDTSLTASLEQGKRPWRKCQTATSTSTSHDESFKVLVKVPPWRK